MSDLRPFETPDAMMERVLGKERWEGLQAHCRAVEVAQYEACEKIIKWMLRTKEER